MHVEESKYVSYNAKCTTCTCTQHVACTCTEHIACTCTEHIACTCTEHIACTCTEHSASHLKHCELLWWVISKDQGSSALDKAPESDYMYKW